MNWVSTCGNVGCWEVEAVGYAGGYEMSDAYEASRIHLVAGALFAHYLFGYQLHRSGPYALAGIGAGAIRYTLDRRSLSGLISNFGALGTFTLTAGVRF